MGHADAPGDDATAVEWRRRAADSAREPIVRRVPYLELKLEHPDLEPTGYADSFYPDAIPYDDGGDRRVFYWRSALAPDAADPDDWRAACATTHALAGVEETPSPAPPLATEDAAAVTVVVDGTVAGDATTARVRSYSPPTVRVTDASAGSAQVTAGGTAHSVSAGERDRTELSAQRVELVGSDTSVTVTPELAVRYPGRREIHHPAPEGSYRLFPSFGLDLDDLPNPLSVPTAGGELDDSALAAATGVDLAERPYGERALWQAFAYAAFDPHADGRPELAQLSTGHVLLWPPEGDGSDPETESARR